MNTCLDATKSSFRGLRYVTYQFFPTSKQFAAGARWVRCDLAIYPVGTRLGSKEAGITKLETIQDAPNMTSWAPGTNRAEQLLGCFLVMPGVMDVEKAMDGAEAVDCGTDEFHLAGLADATPLAPAGTAFPGDAVAQKLTSAFCDAHRPTPDARVQTFAPAKEAWQAGRSFAGCMYWVPAKATQARVNALGTPAQNALWAALNAGRLHGLKKSQVPEFLRNTVQKALPSADVALVAGATLPTIRVTDQYLVTICLVLNPKLVEASSSHIYFVGSAPCLADYPELRKSWGI